MTFAISLAVLSSGACQSDSGGSAKGEVLNRVGFRVEPEVTVSPASGPAGTPIHITMTGIGWKFVENSWQVLYDNQHTGVLTAVTTHGTARAVIPAAGGSGRQIIQVVHGAFTFPYLNGQQSPYPDRPIFFKEFTVTGGEPVLPPPPEEQGLEVLEGQPPDEIDGPTMWLDKTRGPITTPVTLHGAGFEGGQEVRLEWVRAGFSPVDVGSIKGDLKYDMTTVTAHADGTFTHTFDIPDDLGGLHPINAYVGGEQVASAMYTLVPSALPLENASGPPGTMVKIHLKGGGYTETANIFNIVYDNAHIGYACAVNSQGDVQINMPLTGQPGWHFIDLYPGIYKGKETMKVRNFRIPQLTYEEDHPGERLPAFRFAVEVTE